MRRTRAIRFGAVLAVSGLAAGVGCTHNHYYYPTPGAVTVPGTLGPCDPVTIGTPVSSAVIGGQPSLGAVCESPPQGLPGALVAQNPARTTPIVSNAARPIAPRPIYSQPGGRVGPFGNGLVWRGSRSESLATERIEGAYDDTTIK